MTAPSGARDADASRRRRGRRFPHDEFRRQDDALPRLGFIPCTDALNGQLKSAAAERIGLLRRDGDERVSAGERTESVVTGSQCSDS